MRHQCRSSTRELNVMTSLVVAIYFLQASFTAASATPAPTGPSVKITSPLGRSGMPGAIRIVAQINPVAGVDLGPVRFLIDGQLFQTDTDGAPYAVEWVDENP